MKTNTGRSCTYTGTKTGLVFNSTLAVGYVSVPSRSALISDDEDDDDFTV